MLNAKLDDIFGYKLYRAFSLIKGNVFHEFHQNQIDINFEQWIILNRLWEEDKQSQGSLLSKTMQFKGNLTRTLNKMMDEGLIVKEPNPDDSRSHLICLTKQAKGLKSKLRKMAFKQLNLALEGVSKKDLEITNKVLDQVFQNLKKD